jgi:drug/metabolite transporter (DMT)-like permease
MLAPVHDARPRRFASVTAPAATTPAAAPQAGSAIRGIAWMLLAMFAFVMIDAVAKYLAARVPVMQVVWARSVFALLFTLPLLGRHGLRSLGATRRPGLQVVRSGFQFASTVFFFTALKYISLTDAIAIAFVSPLVITALSVPLLGEKVGLRRWLAVAAGFAGVLVIIRPGMAAMHWAVLLPLATAFTSAIYQINTRILAQTDDPGVTLLYTAVIGSAVSTVFMPFVWQWPDASSWALMALLGALGTCGHFVLIQAYARAAASVLAPFVYTQLVWSVGVGFLLFAHLPDGFTLLGALIIAASGIYTAYRERMRRAGADGPSPRA